jgi:hypothetical protein
MASLALGAAGGDWPINAAQGCGIPAALGCGGDQPVATTRSKARREARRKAGQRRNAEDSEQVKVVEETVEDSLTMQEHMPMIAKAQKTFEFPQAEMVDEVVEIEKAQKTFELENIPIWEVPEPVPDMPASSGSQEQSPQAEIVDKVVEMPLHMPMTTNVQNTYDIPQTEIEGTVMKHPQAEMVDKVVPEHASIVTEAQEAFEALQVEIADKPVEIPVHVPMTKHGQEALEVPQADMEDKVIEMPWHAPKITNPQKTSEFPQAGIVDKVVGIPGHMPSTTKVQKASEVIEMPGPTKGKKKKKKNSQKEGEVEPWLDEESYLCLVSSVQEAFYIADDKVEDGPIAAFCSSMLLPRCRKCEDGAKILIQYFVSMGLERDKNQKEYAAFIQKHCEEIVTVYVLLWTQLGWNDCEVKRWIKDVSRDVTAFIVDAVKRAQKSIVKAPFQQGSASSFS